MLPASSIRHVLEVETPYTVPGLTIDGMRQYRQINDIEQLWAKFHGAVLHR
jgi:hypothetical protein